MDRNLAVARSVPAPSHLRLADLHDTEEGDGPTRLFSPDPSYRGSGAETSVSEPAPRTPAGGYLDVNADDVSEVLEGRLDLVIETNPKARTTTAVVEQPMQPQSIDRTQVNANPVMRTPNGCGTQIVERPVMRTPDASGTQVNARPVMRTPDGCGTQVTTPPVMRTPDASGTQVVERPILLVPAPVAEIDVPDLGVPMPIALEKTEMRTSPVIAARLIIAGRYLVGGEDVSEQMHGVGTSFVLARTPTSAFCDDPFVDAQHGALTFRPDGIAIDDFDSTNGVFVRVNGKVSLRSGDMFRAGEELLRFTAMKNTRTAGRAPALGSPDPGYWGRIDVMVTVEDNAASYPIDEVEVSFGQTDGHLQFPDDPFLGELHCRVVRDEKCAVLEDFGTPCGTWLRLRCGDVVPYGAELLVGQTRVRIERE